MPYIFFLVLANILWAGSYSIMKWGVLDVDPITLVFFRFLFAAVTLVLILIIFRKRIQIEFSWYLLKRLFIVALFNQIHHVGIFIGLKYTQAATASIIISMEPVILFVLSTIILKERLTFKHISALFLAIIGFIIISNIGVFNSSQMTTVIFLGNVIVLCAVISEGLFSISFNPLAKKYSPIFLMAIVSVVQTFVLMPVVFYRDPHALSALLSIKTVVVVAYLGILCTVFGYIIWLWIMKKLPINIMAISLFLQPVLGPIMAALFLKENLSLRTLVGGVFIISALIVVSKKRSKKLSAFSFQKERTEN